MTADPGPGTVGVVGAGTMGAGIAQVAALAGHTVLLLDAAPGRAQAATGEIEEALDRLVVRGRLDADRAAAARRRLHPVDTLGDLHGCALVVEAAVERLDVKRVLFAALEEVVGPDCILATNTSSLMVTDVAVGLKAPGRVVGMHFFNPATAMRLVEVVVGARTEPDVVTRVGDLARAWGKTPVRVASSPGSVVNRVARPFFGEALLAVEEGLDPATVDAVLRGSGGFPMGPLELADLIGQDINLATTRSVWEQLGKDVRYAPSAVQEALVAAGSLGRKTGQGFYRYDDGRTGHVDAPPAAPSAAPEKVVVHGDWGPWAPLWRRLADAGIGVVAADVADDARTPAGSPTAEIGGGVLVPTDGRTAGGHAARTGAPVVVLDLAYDPATAERFAVAASPECPPDVLAAAVGLLQATGAAVSVLPDRPGLLVARTVAMLVDEATTVADLAVAGPADIDTALRLGAGHPRGPLEWGDLIGAARVVALLDAVAARTGSPRYRVSAALRRAARTGGALRG